MDESYDIIVLGAGLIETTLAGLLSSRGKRVLLIDRNNYYGGDSPTVNLSDLFTTFRPGQTPPEDWGLKRHWNVDLIPKFTLAKGKLMKVILQSPVANYLQWTCLDGVFVAQSSGVHRVPASKVEALDLLDSPEEKERCGEFFSFVDSYDPANQETWGGLDLARAPFSACVTMFSLTESTVDFIGHAVALYASDSFLTAPCHEVLAKVKLYMDSAVGGNSPFVFPDYGNSCIIEGYTRLSAINGSVVMLSRPVDEILFNEAGEVVGVRCGAEVTHCSSLLCAPAYVQHKVRTTGQVVRAVCVLKHHIPNTENCASGLIVVPQVNRHHDIYVAFTSASNYTCPEGFFVAVCSTVVETEAPEAELQAAYALLGDVADTFVRVYDTYAPIADGSADKVFVTKSFDATSHTESVEEDILSLYARIMGEPLEY